MQFMLGVDLCWVEQINGRAATGHGKTATPWISVLKSEARMV
jgi:hypothetical protein